MELDASEWGLVGEAEAVRLEGVAGLAPKPPGEGSRDLTGIAVVLLLAAFVYANWRLFFRKATKPLYPFAYKRL